MWKNWAGNVVCQPRVTAVPRDEPAVISCVERAARAGSGLRVAGSGHSFTPLCATAATLVSLERLQGLIAVDRSATAPTATAWAGTTIAQLGEPLRAAGVALENQGDVDYQALAGAVATGTHGTGLAFGSLSSCVTALRLVLASGETVPCSPTCEPELFSAARVSLGLLGVVTAITLRVTPAYRLHQRSWVAPFEDTMAQLDEQITANAHFEFFWLPRHDAAVLKALNPTAAPVSAAAPVPAALPGTLERYLVPERVDWSYRVYPSPRMVPFVESEYAVPVERGADCMRELRALMRSRYPAVSWPVEYRTQRADDIMLSPAQGRDSVTLSIHEAPDRPYAAFFAAAEAIFRNHGGRPHWGKLHTLRGRDLRPLYPAWDRFQAVRTRVDPHGLFLTPYLRALMLGA
jgi:FAD/FMN-containing dehydrogenase